jgi:nucleotide-binding universal stress UspA family protein
MMTLSEIKCEWRTGRAGDTPFVLGMAPLAPYNQADYRHSPARVRHDGGTCGRRSTTHNGVTMSYKTVLVHLDDSPGADQRLTLATSIALTGSGHLIGAAMTGVSRFLYQNAVPDDDPNLALHLGFLRERAAASLAGFEARVSGMGLTAYEQRVLDDEAGGGISLLARYADLVVIGQFDPDQAAPSVMSDFPAYVIMNAGRPVLIVPHTSSAPAAAAAPTAALLAAPAPAARPGAFRTVLISWNASNEAGHAVSAALPLLKRADHVIIAVFDAEADRVAHGAEPGADLAVYLARHGIRATVLSRTTERHGPFRRHGDVGDALLALAGEVAADLLVMGAYGHSRLRETIIGGVTRTVLHHMTIPVLMTH